MNLLKYSDRRGTRGNGPIRRKIHDKYLAGIGVVPSWKRRLETFDNLMNTIEDLYIDRNIIAHGKWGTLLPQNLPAAASLRDKDAQALPSDVIIETYPKHRMICILRNIVLSMNSLIKTMNAHETSHGIPIPQHRRR
jgi:hypothetical protein